MNGHEILTNGPIRMDLASKQVFVGDEPLKLSPKEFALLKCFMQAPGRLLSALYILEEVWGPAHTEDLQYIRVFLSQIRTKLSMWQGLGGCIQVKSGFGYQMAALTDEIPPPKVAWPSGVLAPGAPRPRSD